MLEKIKNICNSEEFQKEIIDTLFQICKIDTTPNLDVSIMQQNESAVFAIIKNFLKQNSSLNGKIEKYYINPEIENHKAFSQLHFTKTKVKPEGLTAKETYKNRYNLLYKVDNETDSKGKNVAINAHIDVVAPFSLPEIKDDYMHGRGTIDDKGAVLSILGALKIINQLNDENLITLRNKITAMFVIEEETGGNGSLSLALDKKLKKRYDSLLVMECANNNIYPANRGAVWFKTELKNSRSKKLELLEAMVFAILATEKEGDKIKEESGHPLFPHRPVQTCNGILDSFGAHPSRICGHIAFELRCSQNIDIEKIIKTAITKYINKHGDKTKVIDTVTNKPKIKEHYSISRIEDIYKIDIYGSTGHMGSILENDDAILKFAYIAKYIIEYKYSKNLNISMNLINRKEDENLILEGGQGFLPTHSIDEITNRIKKSFSNGVKEYLKFIKSNDTIEVDVTYNKLHNSAFDGNINSTSFKNAKSAAIQSDLIKENSEIRGWDVSCDARLFAIEYPKMPVITSGPGDLKYAHSDNENLYLPDLFQSIIFTTLFLLKETYCFK